MSRPTAYGPPPQPYLAPPPAAWPGYATQAPPALVPSTRHSSHLKVVGLLVLVGAIVAGVVVAISVVLTPGAKTYVCPPDCGVPPHGRPLAVWKTFTGPGGAYSFEYFSGGHTHVTTDSTGITVVLDKGPTTMKFLGADAAGRTAQQVAHDLITATYPDARRAYEVPNAYVGYRSGYGEVDDVQLQGGQASYSRARLVVMVAVHDDVALVATAIGPYEAATPALTGHPTGLGLTWAVGNVNAISNTMRWRGDPPR